MELRHDERQRCGECGKEAAQLLRFARGPMVCLQCVREADRLLTPPLSAAELQRIRRMLDPYIWPVSVFNDPMGKAFDQDAYEQRVARRLENPNDDLVRGIRLANCDPKE
jgi:hypothetical protein